MKRLIAVMILLGLVVPGALLMPLDAGEPGPELWDGANLVFDASAPLVNAVVRRKIDRTEPVEEVILETPVRGMGRTQGVVYAELIPDSHQATVDIVLDACSESETVATRCCVLIYTATTIPLDIRRRVIIDGKGLRASVGPVHARATTRLLGITDRRGETDTAATTLNGLGFGQKKEESEHESAGKTARKASERLTQELTPSLAKASQSIGRGLIALKGAGLSLESLNFNSTPGILQARLRIATPGRTAPGPYQLLPADVDFGVRVHDSLANEAVEARLGGKTLPLTAAKKIYEEVTRGIFLDTRKENQKTESVRTLEKFLANLGGQPDITFAQKAPLTLAFADQGFTVELHLASIQVGGTHYEGIRARAKYRLQNDKMGAHALRQGPVEFLPITPVGKKLQPQPPTFLAVREVVFLELFKDRLTLAPLALPEAVSSLRFAPPRADIRNGWLAVAWTLQPQAQGTGIASRNLDASMSVRPASRER